MAPADWYPDPSDPARLRYWDGAAWTGHVAPNPWAQGPRPLQRIGGRVIVPSDALVAGLVPDRCSLHGRRGTPSRAQFLSRTPAWVWVTIVAGLVWPLIISLLIRKTVTVHAWPFCEECRGRRRRMLLLVAASLGSWIPLLALYSMLPTSDDGLRLLLLVLVCVVPPSAAVWFAEQSRLARGVGAQVAEDGRTVSFPARAWPRDPSTTAVGVPHGALGV